jgi:hypothetical protein
MGCKMSFCFCLTLFQKNGCINNEFSNILHIYENQMFFLSILARRQQLPQQQQLLLPQQLPQQQLLLLLPPLLQLSLRPLKEMWTY